MISNKLLRIMHVNMKATLIITILILNFQFNLLAQMKLKTGFTVDIYDPSTNQFFDRYKYIDHIAILYKNRRPDVIDVYFRGDVAPYFSERYTLSFDGDLYLINKQAPD